MPAILTDFASSEFVWSATYGKESSTGQMTRWTSYDGIMSSRLVSATEFKAHSLALLDEIQEHGGTIIVTKRGHPVATVSPASPKPWASPKGSWSTRVRIVGDIVNADTSRLWDVARSE